MLERGYIALEEKEWNKANDFFEQVLNQDAKNASAYLGKVFAQVCVSDLKRFVQNRKNLKWNFEKEELMIEENRNLIEEVVEKYVIPSFLERKDVSKQFYYNRRYYSTVLSKKKRCEAEKTYWKNDKNLIRAVKFSTGELKKQLDDGYKNIIGYLEQEVILAEKTKELERKNTEEAYGKYLENTKKKIESMYKEAFQHREDMYREACRLLSEIREQIVNDDVRKWKTDIDIEPIKARTISQIDEIQNKFLILGSYQDSLAFVKECDLLKANVEEKVKEFEKRVEKRNDRIGIVIGLGFTACLVILIILKNFMGL